MGKPYSQDLRERVIAAVDTGTGAYVAARTIHCFPNCEATLQDPYFEVRGRGRNGGQVGKTACRSSLRRALSPTFPAGGMVFFIRWRVVAEEPGAAHFGFSGAMLLDLLGPRSGCWPHDGEVAGGAVADSFLVISGSGRRWSSGGRGDR
jgi:hypothetical protein